MNKISNNTGYTMHTELSSPREVKSKETVERIVSAATSIIDGGDLSKLTVKNVCKLAGVSNGVFSLFQFKERFDHSVHA